MKTIDVDCQEDPDKRSKKPKELFENFSIGGVPFHNYKMSHDGRKILSFGSGSFALYKGAVKKEIPSILYNYELIWDPTNRYFGFINTDMEGQTLRIVDTSGDEPVVKDIYSSKRPAEIYGIEWSPRGNAMYWLERRPKGSKGTHYYLSRVEIGGSPKVLIEDSNNIDFFMPPVTWFEHGQGRTSKDYWIVYGTKDGLFIISRDGKKREILTQAPAVGVTNLEWSPDGMKIVIYFQRNFISPKYGTLKGVCLAHLKKEGGSLKLDKMETLYEGKQIHTLWFSPEGTYVTWMKEGGCWFRKPEDEGQAAIKIPPPVVEDDKGNKIIMSDKPIKGGIWNEDETRLAITAGNQVWIYNTISKKTDLYHEFGGALSHFVAEPRWKGNRLILTIFENINLTGREAPKRVVPDDPEADARSKMLADKRSFLKDQRAQIDARRKAKAAKEKAAKDKKIREAEKERKEAQRKEEKEKKKNE